MSELSELRLRNESRHVSECFFPKSNVLWPIMHGTNNKIVIVGTISNVEHVLANEVHRVLRAFSDFQVLQILLVESDSSDSTIEVLEQLQKKLPFLQFSSLGELRLEIPDRIDRIRYCRNKYISMIRTLPNRNLIDYVVVVDLDGMNSRLSRRAVRSCFKRDNWDAVTANQLFGYYDLLALRHQEWCPTDVISEMRTKQKILENKLSIGEIKSSSILLRMHYDKIRKDSLYSRMKILLPGSPWIPVDSSFGGLGIYKPWIFENYDYDLEKSSVKGECEHVTLHSKVISSKGKIFINPSLINNFINTYNMNKIFVIRQIRELFWNSQVYRLIKNR